MRFECLHQIYKDRYDCVSCQSKCVILLLLAFNRIVEFSVTLFWLDKALAL